jgi:hypothetical protein
MPTLSSDWIGKKSRVCSVVNATSVPIVIARCRGDRQPGEQVDERGHDRERHLHRRHPPAAGHREATSRSASSETRAEPLGEVGRRPIVGRAGCR